MNSTLVARIDGIEATPIKYADLRAIKIKMSSDGRVISAKMPTAEGVKNAGKGYLYLMPSDKKMEETPIAKTEIAKPEKRNFIKILKGNNTAKVAKVPEAVANVYRNNNEVKFPASNGVESVAESTVEAIQPQVEAEVTPIAAPVAEAPVFEPYVESTEQAPIALEQTAMNGGLPVEEIKNPDVSQIEGTNSENPPMVEAPAPIAVESQDKRIIGEQSEIGTTAPEKDRDQSQSPSVDEYMGRYPSDTAVELVSGLTQLRQNYVETKATLEKTQKLLVQAESEGAETKQQLEQANAKITELMHKLTEMETSLKEAQAKIVDLENKRTQDLAKLQASNAELEKIRIDYNKLKVDYEKLQHAYAHLTEKVRSILAPVDDIYKYRKENIPDTSSEMKMAA